MRNLSPLLFWIPFALMGQLALGQGSATAPSSAARSILAGAYARNIDPQSFPVWVSGGIVAGKGERVVDSLFARSLVIESGEERLAVCVVDKHPRTPRYRLL